MTTRRNILAAAILVLTRPSMAQQAPEAATASAAPPATPSAPPRPRARPRRAATPPPPPEPPPRISRGDPAPVPNNDLEAPAQRSAQRGAPQLNPALIDPASPQIGTSRDGASLQSREDRLLRQPAAGARLRLPFGY
ncbi:hypothetical protein AAFN86_10580 [Roseomonas sp. CAU 1739]|uniref:hypothetical protein n=1 Tax=Roseomonas sp. CAU 1739 TaxID=3140364 RepID=UPI00325AA3C3